MAGLQKWEADGRWDAQGINEQVRTGGHKWTYP
jgi:hypothetical protein